MKNQVDKIAWAGTAFSIAGAFLVANAVFLPGFISFTVDAVLWLIVAKIQQNNALFFLQASFLLANINGIVVNL